MKSSQPLKCVGENNIREVIIAPNVIVHSNEQLEELRQIVLALKAVSMASIEHSTLDNDSDSEIQLHTKKGK